MYVYASVAGGQSHWDCFFHVDNGLTAAGDLLKNVSEDNRRSFFAHGRDDGTAYGKLPWECRPSARAHSHGRKDRCAARRRDPHGTARPARTAQGQAVPHRTAPDRAKPSSPDAVYLVGTLPSCAWSKFGTFLASNLYTPMLAELGSLLELNDPMPVTPL